MKNSKAIIIKLAKMGILETKEIPTYLQPEENDELTYEIVDERTYECHRYKVITDEHFDEDVPIAIMTKLCADIKTIKNIAIFFAVLTGISLVISIISAVSIASLF